MHRPQGQEITGNALVCQALFQGSIFAVAAHLDVVTAAWLSCEPAIQPSLPLLPMALLPPTITCLGRDSSLPPVLSMAINKALSHHHASCFPLQDPATPTQSKIKAGGPSQNTLLTPNPVGF